MSHDPEQQPAPPVPVASGPPKPTVLVVDDEAAVRYTLRSILEEEAISVIEAADGVAALELVDRGGVDLVLTDLRMPRMDGMALLSELGTRPGAPRVIMITAYGSERLAVEAIKRGALDYFAKPFEAEEIVRVVARSLETVRLSAENRALRAELALRKLMVFDSAAMRRVAELVERVASRDITVLISGESGTGKELVARAIVKASRRAEAAFVQFNCAALPRELAEAELFGHSRGAFTGAARARVGLFREAAGGTLLLDEIGELDLLTQGKLLRVLQEREVRPVGEDRAVPVDVRILAATNRDLAEAVRQGSFRQDLYYRLHVVALHLPPLRERREDVAPLAQHFAERFALRYGLDRVRLSPELLARLGARSWPGNVRELENTIERLLALSDAPEIGAEALGDEAAGATELAPAASEPPSPGLKDRVAVFERGLIAAELERCHGNQSEAARRLGVSRPTLIDKLRKLGLK
jgi:two-component system, NtrC family, response regulator HydG